MTLAELFKVPPNIYYRVAPDHFFMHNDIVLNLKTKERINVDWTKPLRPQLNIPDDAGLLYIFVETDTMMKAYIEYPTSISWYYLNKINNRGANIIRPIMGEVASFHTKITVCKYKSGTFSEELPIFEKVITISGDTLWKKTIWAPDNTHMLREIYHNGMIYEYNKEHRMSFILNPEVEPDPEKRYEICGVLKYY